MTKKKRKELFDAAMREGYDKYRDGVITSQDWNNWSGACYKFLDEEITYEVLEEKLDG